MRLARGFSVVFAVASLIGSTAWAHIDLLEPEARAHGTAARGDIEIDANSELKRAPCGQVTPGRTERVTTYAAGQIITVRVREENAHVSYIRVSLDLDGEDFPLRSQAATGPEPQEVAAAAEAALGGDGLLAVYREDNDVPGFVHAIEVTLPEASCNNCTLQVLQYMYDDPSAPYYFQCADLVIVSATEPTEAGALPSDAGIAEGGSAAGAEAAVSPASGAGITPADDTSSTPLIGPSAGSGEMTVGASANAAPEAEPPSLAAASRDGGGCSTSHGEGDRWIAMCVGLLALGIGSARRRR